MKDYDVVVVGAGPVGSTFARYIAKKGFNVGILEKKKEVGIPLQCAGLVSKKIEDVNILPDEFIINKIKGAYLHSPSGLRLSVAKKKPEAYVLDRVAYDRFLAKLAVDEGAELFLNHRVERVNTKTGEVHLKNKKISAEVIVGADGYQSVVSRIFNPISETMQAAQCLVNAHEEIFDNDCVHIHVNSRISPGFLWIIPLSKSTARVGLSACSGYRDLSRTLKEFLSHDERFQKASIPKKYHGVIPVYDPKKKIVDGRTILVGDAASQVKPTTGGGLTMGSICAEIASEVVSSAISSEDPKILKDYDSKYKEIFEDELKLQLKIRKIFELLDNKDLDFMFLKLKEKGAEKLISKYGDMDSHMPLIGNMFKTGMIFSILPKILTGRLSNLWNFF